MDELLFGLVLVGAVVFGGESPHFARALFVKLMRMLAFWREHFRVIVERDGDRSAWTERPEGIGQRSAIVRHEGCSCRPAIQKSFVRLLPQHTGREGFRLVRDGAEIPLYQ